MRRLATGLVLLTACLSTGAARGALCPPQQGDVAPGVLEPGGLTPTWRVDGDGVIDVADVVALIRAAVGLQDMAGTGTCATMPGDIAPGLSDATTDPPTWRPDPDGSVTVADIVVALRAAVGLQQVEWDGSELARLVTAPGCQDILDRLRGEAVADMESRLSLQLAMALEVLGFGCDPYQNPYLDGTESDADGVPTAGGGPSPSTPEASEYSETNTQVAGVDEADFVKNDGGYLYVLAHGHLQVVDAWPADESHRVASYPIEGDPRRMFVHADRALVFSSLDRLADRNGWSDLYGNYRPRECTYGYDCELTGDGRALKITVLDISDRAAPRLEREIYVSSSYLTSRRIGDAVHVAVVSADAPGPPVSVWPPELTPIGEWYPHCEAQGSWPYTAEEIVAAFSRLEETNRQAILGTPITDFLPGIRDVRWSGGRADVREELLGECDAIHGTQVDDKEGLLTVLSLDMTQSGSVAATSIVSRPGAVHASRDALYVAVRQYRGAGDWYFPARDDVRHATTVHRFRFLPDAQGTAYEGSGVVKGWVLNQFSIDEHEGYLRVATSLGRVPDPNVTSGITVLARVDGMLETVGVVEGLAPQEDIRAARFAGDVGYLVTFKKTDPLFVVDLSDPYRPAVRGELHVPGFSTYLHLLDDDHLLAIGYDADDAGSRAYFQGIQLQVFDVSDAADPQLLHREIIGARGSTTDAATDHLAFNFFRARDLLAFPMVVCEGGAGGGSYGTEIAFSGLLVYRVTVAGGFESLGGLPHGAPDGTTDCSNWWTRSDSWVKRSAFLDDWTYSIAQDSVRVAPVGALGVPVAEVSLVP